jgi:predicted Rossmann fold flavoprotein
MQMVDVIIIGAGAAGLMCAIESGQRQRKTLVLDHANKAGKKILMSGGGRCNFTNLTISPDHFISHNPHFCKSALSRYTQWDFISLVKKHRIAFHEKTLGQLFCDEKAKDILNMLLTECELSHAEIRLNTSILKIENPSPKQFIVTTNQGKIQSESLVIACGGLSIPTMGASAFGYKVAEQFNLNVWPTRAGLVPLTLQLDDKEKLATLSGISVNVSVESATKQFKENILFTHRGLSGPAILQISSYWKFGESLAFNFLPDLLIGQHLEACKATHPLKQLNSVLIDFFPKRFVDIFLPLHAEIKLKSLSPRDLIFIEQQLHSFQIKPNGTEGYRTAEVTLGGVDCDAISSKTMEAYQIPGLHFIGEVLDVTGWLGGYNFQWAWSSGWAAGQVV